MPIRVLVVDDHAVLREGLRLILASQPDVVVAGEASEGYEAVRCAGEIRPDVVILDLALPGLHGIEVARAISSNVRETRILVLSMFHTREHVARAMQAGARGYVLKESAGADVVAAIRAVAAGELYFGHGVEPPAAGDSAVRDTLQALSAREREVLQYVVEGRTSADIAAQLRLSPKSVETYRSRMMRKFGTKNVAALVRYALDHGFMPRR